MPVHREVRTSATESKYSSAVVKPGKLYVVQTQIGQRFTAARWSWRVECLSGSVMVRLDE